MRFHHSVFAIALFVAVLPRLAARETIGGYATWAAFCDKPRECFAISSPAERHGRPFLTISITGRDSRIETFVGREIRTATLQIGEALFPLTPSGQTASADSRTSRRIVAAIRTGETMTVFGTSSSGRFRHHYRVAGAPSAIDAAAIASLRH